MIILIFLLTSDFGGAVCRIESVGVVDGYEHGGGDYSRYAFDFQVTPTARNEGKRKKRLRKHRTSLVFILTQCVFKKCHCVKKVGVDNVSFCSKRCGRMIFVVVRAVMPKNRFVGTLHFQSTRGH